MKEFWNIYDNKRQISVEINTVGCYVQPEVLKFSIFGSFGRMIVDSGIGVGMVVVGSEEQIR